MLTYNLDIEDRSRWLIATPSAAQVAEPYYCSEVGVFYAHEKFSTARSGKDSYIVFYTLEGEGVVHQGGQRISLTPGHALLMDCRTPQTYRTAPSCDRWFHLWAHIDGTGVELAGRELGLPRLTPIRVRQTNLQPHFDTLFGRLKDEAAGGRARTGLAAHGLVTELVAAHAYAQGSHDDDSPVARVVAYVDANTAEKLSLDELAGVASVSPSHLVRLFRERLGTTPHDYVLRRRISLAKELLAETDLTSAAIAKRVGFASESNFSYRFSKMVGQSPRAYRAGSPGVSA